MDDIEVRGGAGSIEVALDSLEDSVPRLRTAAGDVLDLAVEIGRIGLHPCLVPAAVVAPGSTLEVEAQVLDVAGPAGLAGEALEIRTLADTVALAVDLYRAGEAAADRAVAGVEDTVGLVAGAAAPMVVLPVIGLGLAGTAAVRAPFEPLSPTWLPRYARELGSATGDLVAGAGPWTARFLFEHPWLLQHGVGGGEGVILGLGLGLPPAGVYLSWAARRAGVPFPPRTHAEAVAVLDAAALGRALDESAFEVATTATPVDTCRWRRPARLSDLVGEQADVSGQGRVRVSGIPLRDGRYAWVVDVPGTRTFDPVPGEDPWDQTSNQLLMARERTLTMRAVTTALSDAKDRAGRGTDGLDDPVLLGGHSQGGITAAALTADPVFRAEHPGLSHLVTTGAPVARMPVPRGVRTLSIEHRQDLVPHLDGADNPARRDWVTVTRDVAGTPGVDGRATSAHESDRYVETARLVDERTATDASLREWREGADAFLGGPGGAVDPTREVVVVDYEVRRVPRAP